MRSPLFWPHRTFNEINAEEQYRLCQKLCSDLAEDMQKEGLKVGNLTKCKIQNSSFLCSLVWCFSPPTPFPNQASRIF